MTTTQKIIKKRTIIGCVESVLDNVDWLVKSALNDLDELNATIDANLGEMSDYQCEEKLRIETRIDFYNKLTKFLDDFV